MDIVIIFYWTECGCFRSPDDADITPGFRREGFGRQSVSEKRKGHIDPKNMEVYLKIKGSKDKTPHIYGKKCTEI